MSNVRDDKRGTRGTRGTRRPRRVLDGERGTQPPLLVIAGATATGKTGLAIDVAERLAGEGITAEIISADSRQVYRDLDIGTAKAMLDERRGIPHHGIDLVEPDQPFTVADFTDHARGVLAELAGRPTPTVAILAGGTGFYLRAVARGLETEALPSDADVRARLEAEFLSVGLDPLVERLRMMAPTRAATIDVANPRRVVRALEIATVAGDEYLLPEPAGYDGPVAWIGLSVEPAIHRAWIATRARSQFDRGLIEEARALRERFDPRLPAFSAIGYREAWALLDGTMDREAAMAEDARRNVAFAKRQRTWFRREPAITWLDAAEPDISERALIAARGLGVRATG